jgi:16S rRNA (uracil1498-N3)-methyltransferase
VLRLSTGNEVGVFDGRGREWVGRVAAANKNVVEIELIGESTPIPEPPVRVTLGVGLLKGDQMDVVVRDATMLGVAEIAPIVTDHAAVSARAVRADRWRRVAVASAKQCRRAVVPKVRSAATLNEILTGTRDSQQLICLEPGATGIEATPLTALARPSTVLLLVGPEGGWSAAEIATAREAGAQAISLGPRTLRAEAAPAVALAGLWTVWGW